MPLQFYARARFQSEIWGKDASKQTLGPRRESEHATRATKAGREKGEREKERERQARRQEGKGPGVADARARLCGSECAGYITGRMPSFFSLALIVVATTRSNSTKKGLCWSRSRRSLLRWRGVRFPLRAYSVRDVQFSGPDIDRDRSPARNRDKRSKGPRTRKFSRSFVLGLPYAFNVWPRVSFRLPFVKRVNLL